MTIDENLVLARRHFFRLVAGAALLGACRSDGVAREDAVPRGRLEGPVVPEADRLTTEQLASWADRFAKTWSGAWLDDGGGSGSAQVTVSVNPSAGSATVALAMGEGFLRAGSKLAPASYEIDLTRVGSGAKKLRVASPQLGEVDIEVHDLGAVKLTCRNVPGHADINRIDIDVLSGAAGDSATVAYRIVRGEKVTIGSMDLTSGDGKPPGPDEWGPSPRAAYVSGGYAASLVTGAELSRAFGITVHDPVAGRGFVEPSGKAGSDALARTDDPAVFVSVRVSRYPDAFSARLYLQELGASGVPVEGLGDGATLTTLVVAGISVLKGKEVVSISWSALNMADPEASARALAEVLKPKFGPS